MKTNNQGAKNKNSRIWGWVLAIVGGLFVCFSVYIKVGFIAEVAPSVTVEELLINVLALILYGPALPLGILILFVGIWLIKRKEKTPAVEEEGRRNSNRIWGWILTIVGGLFMVLGIWVGIETFNTFFTVGKVSEPVFFGTPYLVIGILLVILGSRLLIRKEKIPPGELDGLDNPQSEVER